MRLSTWVALIESPPRAKKLSLILIDGIFKTSCQISARHDSLTFRGSTNSACKRSASNCAHRVRWSLPVELAGIASTSESVPGTLWPTNRAARCCTQMQALEPLLFRNTTAAATSSPNVG